MRIGVALLLTITACRRGPVVDLAVCAGGSPSDASVRHEMAINASGRVSVDGTTCASRAEVKRAVRTVASAMHRSPVTSAELAPDEPLVVRIDGATPLIDAVRSLEASRYGAGIYRTWISVRDPDTLGEVFIKLEKSRPIGGGDRPYNPHWQPKKNHVSLELWADDTSWWSDHEERAPAWFVERRQANQVVTDSHPVTWAEVRDLIAQVSAEDRDYTVQAALPRNAPWREIAPIVAEARSLFDARVEFMWWPNPSERAEDAR